MSLYDLAPLRYRHTGGGQYPAFHKKPSLPRKRESIRSVAIDKIARHYKPMSKQPFVYITASKPGGVLYVGVTSNLPQRIWQHKNNITEGFTQKYEVHNLVYFEEHNSMEAAITREKQIKHWARAWKVKLIRENNPKWDDLYSKLIS